MDLAELIAERAKVSDDWRAKLQARAALAGTKRYSDMRRLSAEIEDLKKRWYELAGQIKQLGGK